MDRVDFLEDVNVNLVYVKGQINSYKLQTGAVYKRVFYIDSILKKLNEVTSEVNHLIKIEKGEESER